MKPGLLLMCLFVAVRLMGAETLLPQSSSSTNLPKPEVSPPKDEARNFQIKRGFRMETVASEPLVKDAIAMAFDENGRLFVLEAPGRVAGEPVKGRVCVLEDTDGNGKFSSRTVYAEDITNPTALTCYDGGVFVGASGQILYLKDSKGNGVADVRREIFKSFGDATNGANGQVVITGMAWGLDNRIHAVTAGSGGDVISSSIANQSIVLSEGSFSFDPRTSFLTAESGSGASGLSFDDRGQKYICKPTHHIELIMSDPHYKTRNPFYTPPSATWILSAQPATQFIYPPIHAGTISPAPVHFTAASGIAIYRGNAFPREYIGDAFVADTIAGVVHHDHIVHNGLETIAERPGDEQAYEFLANYDGSFQPTEVINGPDGALYVTGLMHAMEAPVKRKTNGSPASALPELGRIFRVLPLNFKQPKFVALGRLSPEQLVSMLRHPNGWQRDAASRLLYEHQDRATVVPLIRLLFDPITPPLARMHALRALDGIELTVNGRPTHALLESHLLKALTDPDERVREQAVLISEKFVSQAGLWSDNLWGQLSQMGNDPSPQVRWQLAFTLGQGRNPGRVQTLANIVRSDPGMFPAVLTSLADDAAEMFTMVMNDATIRNTAAGQEGLRGLVTIIGMKNEPAEIIRVLNILLNHPDAAFAFQTALQLEDGLGQADSALLTDSTIQAVRPLFARASLVAVDMNADASARAEALKFLATGSSVDATIPIAFARQWPNLPSTLRKEALAAFLTRPEWISSLMVTMQSALIPRSELDSDEIRLLLAYPMSNLRPLAEALFANWPSLQRQPLVGRYQAALQMSPNAERGHSLFAKNCSVCHRTADESDPPFANYTLANAPNVAKQKMLAAIMAPNQANASGHSMSLFQLRNGQFLAGYLADQTVKSILVCDLESVSHHLARSMVAGQTNLGISGMPEDWENTLTAQDMADLLEYSLTGRK